MRCAPPTAGQLHDFFQGVAGFVHTEQLLSSPEDVLSAVDVMSLPGMPHNVLVYFWECVGEQFAELAAYDSNWYQDGSAHSDQNMSDGSETSEHSSDSSEVIPENSSHGTCDNANANRGGTVSNVTAPVEGMTVVEQQFSSSGAEAPSSVNKSSLPVECRLCPRFPELWPLALSHGLVRTALHNVLLHCSAEHLVGLLDVILRYLEPKIDDDQEVCDLIAQLGLDSQTLDLELARPNVDGECSTRAVRLLAKTILGPTVPRQEMRYSWPLNLIREESFVKEVFFTPENSALASNDERDASDMAVAVLASSSKFEASPRKRARPSKFELLCENSVRFTLTVESEPEEAAIVMLRWRPGAIFAHVRQKLIVRLEVLDNNCCCTESSFAKYKGKRRCLVRGTSGLPVQEGSLITLHIDEEMLESYCSAHQELCEVTISMMVRLVDED